MPKGCLYHMTVGKHYIPHGPWMSIAFFRNLLVFLSVLCELADSQPPKIIMTNILTQFHKKNSMESVNEPTTSPTNRLNTFNRVRVAGRQTPRSTSTIAKCRHNVYNHNTYGEKKARPLTDSEIAVRLSALCIGRALLPRQIFGNRFRYRLIRTQGHSAAGGIM